MLRNAARLRQKDVAKILGVVPSAITGYEADDSNPRASTLDRYLGAVGCTWADLGMAMMAVDADENAGPEDLHPTPASKVETALLSRDLLALRAELNELKQHVYERTLAGMSEGARSDALKKKADDEGETNGPPSSRT